MTSPNRASHNTANDTGATSDEDDFSTEEAWGGVQYYDGEAVILAPNYDGRKNVAALLWTKSLDLQGRKTWLLKIEAEKTRKDYVIKSQKLDKAAKMARERAAVVQTSLLEHTLKVAHEQNPSPQQFAQLQFLEDSWRIAMEECDDAMIEREDLWIRQEQIDEEHRQALESIYMIAFNACAAAGLPLNDASVEEDNTTLEETLQAKITVLRQEVEEGEENLQNYTYFYPTAFNAYFRELEKRVAIQHGKDSDQVRALRTQLHHWTPDQKAERFAPIFFMRSKPMIKRLAVAQLALRAALNQAEALAKGQR
jgi:hypothetical protein